MTEEFFLDRFFRSLGRLISPEQVTGNASSPVPSNNRLPGSEVALGLIGDPFPLPLPEPSSPDDTSNSDSPPHAPAPDGPERTSSVTYSCCTPRQNVRCC